MSKFFSSYKGRQVAAGQKVQVYRNLNKPGVTYSIRDAETGLVLGHAEQILLCSCKFVVSQAGRKRVRATKKKEIHAYIEGYFSIGHAGDDKVFSDGSYARYNPYLHETFVCGDWSRPISSCGVAYITEHGVFVK